MESTDTGQSMSPAAPFCVCSAMLNRTAKQISGPPASLIDGPVDQGGVSSSCSASPHHRPSSTAAYAAVRSEEDFFTSLSM
ncbi:hypothetical protein [Streptomyces sp. ECR3]|uniref:hypothetical protein n=1 Tax=Streptomyces sp. ECR3 TaxID=3400630 RepID=UPI003F1A945D